MVSSTPELILTAARDAANAARTAIETPDRRMTYAELAQSIERIAGGLTAHGLQRGERVAILAPRTIEAVAALFGVMHAGGVPCYFDARATAEQLAVRVQVGGVTTVLFDPALTDTAAALHLPRSISINYVTGSEPARIGDLAPDDEALLLFTSGSSGKPKGVVLTHANLLHHAAAMNQHTRMTRDDRLLHVMPLFHTNGINNQVIAPLACGATIVLLDRFRAETFFSDVAAFRPTYITGVPTMYSRLLEHKPPPDLASYVRIARCGSAPITEALHREVERHLGVPLVISYGLSEATCASTMNPIDARRIGTVGVAIPGVRVAVLAPGALAELPINTEGEVCIAGPTLMKRYTSPSAGGLEIDRGWLRTGDLGRIDDDGYLQITGRIKDLIIRGGVNLSPTAIEAALLAHEAVKHCCVVGAPDADLGEVPVAYVVRRSDATASDLQAAVAQRLSRPHIPQRIVFMDILPENATGKINRTALKAQAAQDR
jgi:malonyl-CoA/methylmalonyl-CoA synthetase